MAESPLGVQASFRVPASPPKCAPLFVGHASLQPGTSLDPLTDPEKDRTSVLGVTVSNVQMAKLRPREVQRLPGDAQSGQVARIRPLAVPSSVSCWQPQDAK